MKKNYTSPELNMTVITNSDILNQSDVLIDGSDLFGDTNE